MFISVIKCFFYNRRVLFLFVCLTFIILALFSKSVPIVCEKAQIDETNRCNWNKKCPSCPTLIVNPTPEKNNNKQQNHQLIVIRRRKFLHHLFLTTITF